MTAPSTFASRAFLTILLVTLGIPTPVRAQLPDREVRFNISVAEPRGGFVSSIAVEFTAVGAGGTRSTVAGSPITLSRSGNSFTGTFQVPQGLVDVSLEAVYRVVTTDPVLGTAQLTGLPNRTFKFTDPGSATYNRYAVSEQISFRPITVQTVVLEDGVSANTDDAGVNVSGLVRAGRVAIVARLLRGAFHAGTCSTFVPVGGGFLERDAALDLKGLLKRAGTLANLETSVHVAPPWPAVLRVVFDVNLAWVTDLRTAVRAALLAAGVPAADAETISDVRVVSDPTYAATRWIRSPIEGTWIEVTPTFDRTSPNEGDTLMHEWTHELNYRLGTWVIPSRPGGACPTAHSFGNPAVCAGLAFDEALAHVVGSHLLGRIVSGTGGLRVGDGANWADDARDTRRAIAIANRNLVFHNSARNNPGGWIEDVIAGALLETYRQRGLDPDGNPAATLAAIITDLRGYAAAEPTAEQRTAEGFYAYLRTARTAAAGADQGRVIDQIALWYQISERARIAQIDHLVPVTLAVEGSSSVAANTPVALKASALAFHRLAETNAYPKIRVRLFDGATQVGPDIPLDPDTTTAGYNFVARTNQSWPTDGTHSVRAEVWGEFVDGHDEVLGASASVTVTIAGDPKGVAERKRTWLKDCEPYLEELVRLDDRAFTALEKSVHAEILKRVAEGRYPSGLTQSEQQRMQQLETELGQDAGRLTKVRDPLTGEEHIGWVASGTTDPGRDAKAKELSNLRAKADSEYAITHYELECIASALDEHVGHKRDLKARQQALQDSKAFKYFSEYAGFNDWAGYLEEVKKIEAILKLPDPLPQPPALPWSYTAPCAAPSTAPTPGGLVVSVVATPKVVAPGADSKISAAVKGGTAPYSFTWSGETSATGENATFASVVPGEHTISVNVADSTGKTGPGSVVVSVQSVEVRLEISPPGTRVKLGDVRTLTATVLSGGQPITGTFTYRWEPRPDQTFDPPEDTQPSARVTFDRPGLVKLWVTVLADRGGTLATVGESQQLEVTVGSPGMSIGFAPGTPYVGQATTATVAFATPVAPDKVDIRWQVPDGAKLLTESTDRREITFAPKVSDPLTFTATAIVPNDGTPIDNATATLSARAFDVTIAIISPPGGVKPGGIAEGDDVVLRASIKPAPAGAVRYLWFVKEDGSNKFSSANAGIEVTVHRNSTGTCEVLAEASDANGYKLGKGATTFEVTVSQADLDRTRKAKEAADKIAEAKQLVRKGKLDEAITLADEAVALDPANAEAKKLAADWKAARETIRKQLAEAEQRMAEEHFPEAEAAYRVAERANTYYAPVQAFWTRLTEAWRARDSKVFVGLDAIRSASDQKQYRKALDTAAKLRTDLKVIGPRETELVELEKYATAQEAVRERKRPLLASAETKLAAYDFDGAIVDLTEFNRDVYQYWNVSLDPEIPRYNKLYTEATTKKRRIDELMPAIRSVAESQSKFANQILESAIQKADEVLSIQPTNVEAKRYRDAIAARLAGGKSKDEFEHGRQLSDAKQYPAAIDAFTKAIAADPNNAEAFRLRGVAKRNTGDLTGSLEDFRQAIKLDPANAKAFYGRGATKEKMDNLDGAVKDYTRAIEIDSAYASAYAGRASAQLTAKSFAESIADYDKAISIGPPNAGSLNNRGVAKDGLGDLKGALADFEAAVRLDPNYKTAVDNAAKVRARLAKTKPNGDAIVQPKDDEVLFTTDNVYGVSNSPTSVAEFTVDSPRMVTYLRTYHWNNGRGTTEPGTVALKRNDGRVFGPWNATGQPGQGGVPNANWVAAPKVLIPAGRYTVVDSDPATWSRNEASRGRGMVVVMGRRTTPKVDEPNTPTVDEPKSTSTHARTVVALFENKSTEAVHIFVDGQTFGPNNKLAPGEKREVELAMPADGRIRFHAGRNGQEFAVKVWDGDPDDLTRFPHVVYDGGTRLVVMTGLR